MTLAVLKGKAQELGVVQSGSKKDGTTAWRFLMLDKQSATCPALAIHGVQDLIERLRSLAQPKTHVLKSHES